MIDNAPPVDGEFREVVPDTRALVLPDLDPRKAGNGRRVLGRGEKRLAIVPRDPEGKPWDIVRGETTNWYLRFEIFRSLGPERTMAAAYRKWQNDEAARQHRELVEQARATGQATPESPTLKIARSHSSAPTSWHTAKEHFRWLERANAWDRNVAETVREAEMAKLRAARQSQVQAGTILRSTGMLAIKEIRKDIKQVKPGEAVLMVKVGDEMVSKGLGLDDAKEATEGTVHVKVIDLGDD